ncbi:MAG: hypothetical protein JO364_13655 [Pseudonocardiales bacterium]|nr:hypothetical protein [Pseudonocardiales bacterium]MBV9031317.1 hypothetical protein [Pseudonocardiales bacterium]
MDRDGTVTPQAAILAGIPRLRGANCAGHHRMYDPVAGRGHQHRDRERGRADPCVATSHEVIH